LRTGEETETFSNRVSAILSPLATDLEDPVARLLAIHDSMNAAKEMQAALPVDVIQDMVEFAPPALAARAARMTSRVRMADRTNPPFNFVISNVFGPRSPLYLAGARMTGFYPVSTVTDGQGVNMTVHSYLGSLDWGFISCRELMPDVWELTDHLHEAMSELLDAAHAHGRGARRRR
jgi:WS/DGAT/MGAT family acyltransferase